MKDPALVDLKKRCLETLDRVVQKGQQPDPPFQAASRSAARSGPVTYSQIKSTRMLESKRQSSTSGRVVKMRPARPSRLTLATTQTGSSRLQRNPRFSVGCSWLTTFGNLYAV